MTRALMFQGTGSDVGKSILVAGLCRVLHRQGIKVWPFKPQNMSNNAAVTSDGGEIGRAQWLQAIAAGVEPSVHMNPVLLKPDTDMHSQVVLQGRVHGRYSARDYMRSRDALIGAVQESFAIAKASADIVLIEGAGSAAEVNLRARDIANMGFARAANVPVVIIGDIDRGGVIASLVGTHAVLDADDRSMIKGFLINKFRGDPRLFDDGLTAITDATGWQSFGVLPWVSAARELPAEDAVILENLSGAAPQSLKIVVPLLSRIANFDDLDPLKAEDTVTLEMIPPGRPLPRDADLIVLPGTKATRADLDFLRAQGWDIDIKAHVRHGGRVLGICGGYQMLGHVVRDPLGLEGEAGETPGLGLLNVETVLAPEKILRAVTGVAVDGNVPIETAVVDGYEIHAGYTSGPDILRPVLKIGNQDHGALSLDRRIAGVYIHGLFGHSDYRRYFLQSLGYQQRRMIDYRTSVDQALTAMADAMEAHLDVAGLLALAQ